MFGLGFIELLIISFILLPFFINISLARSRDKSITLMVILTLLFSWLVTLILAFVPKAQKQIEE